jgi:hypothetical protein
MPNPTLKAILERIGDGQDLTPGGWNVGFDVDSYGIPVEGVSSWWLEVGESVICRFGKATMADCYLMESAKDLLELAVEQDEEIGQLIKEEQQMEAALVNADVYFAAIAAKTDDPVIMQLALRGLRHEEAPSQEELDTLQSHDYLEELETLRESEARLKERLSEAVEAIQTVASMATESFYADERRITAYVNDILSRLTETENNET